MTLEVVDEQVLLALLNSTPVVDGVPRDLLDTDVAAAGWARELGGTGTVAEAKQLRHTRARLQDVVRGVAPASALNPELAGVRLRPEVAGSGPEWRLDVADEDRRLGGRALLAWIRVQERLPGRLRPCANEECRLFLLDRSRPNTARWCSMRTCGNRLKARRHYQRRQRGD